MDKNNLSSDTSLPSEIKKYESHPLIDHAQLDYRVQTCLTPNDPFYHSAGSWGQEYSDLYGLHTIKVNDAWNYTTGFNHEIEDLRKAGERIFTIKRVINNKLGVTADDDYIPSMLLKPLEGGTEGRVPDFARQKKEYYEFRKWDASGKPSKEKLKELDLEFTIKDIWSGE